MLVKMVESMEGTDEERRYDRVMRRIGAGVAVAAITGLVAVIALKGKKIGGAGDTKRTPTNERNGDIMPLELQDGSRWNLHDFDGDNVIDAMVRISRHGDARFTEFVAPEYMGKVRGQYHGTKEMDVGLRNSVSLLYQAKKGLSKQISEALRRK